MVRKGFVGGICCLAIAVTGAVLAGDREQAIRIHDRLAGVPPTAATLDSMEALIASYNASGQTNGDGEAAAAIAMNHPDFYRVTLKNMITPWTNEEQTVFAPLNDYTATVIGIIRDEYDFRSILSGDVLYVGSGISPAYASDNNDHYEAMSDDNSDLQTILNRTTQSGTYSLASGPFPSSATAGVMTTRQGAKAFFVAGTNRAMFRFTLLNHLCTDLEQIKDTSRSPDRVRQDVSRSPGGDSRLYMNACVGCHAGMDPLAQAFAYYEYAYDPNTDPEAENGELEFTNGVVQPKYHINENNFEYGYRTPDDRWTNYWRAGPNSVLGWANNTTGIPTPGNGEGNGAKSMGVELANSEAFARCQVKKVFRAVCLRDPVTQGDRDQIDAMTASFKTANGINTTTGFNIKQAFAESALYCRGD